MGGFLPKTEEGIKQMKIKELKNGRLAMLAVSGAMTQGVLFNQHHFPFQPLNALPGQLVVKNEQGTTFSLKDGYREEFAQGLVGAEYGGWGRHEYDPLDLAARWPEHLPWYREAELKHGRVAMLAWLGLVVPDFVRIPLSDFEAADLDFVNTHNKLIYSLGFGKGFLPKTEEGIVQMKIKELKNGRLAMLAVSGAMTQGVLFNVHHFPFQP